MTTDEVNNEESSTLDTLRQRIAAKKQHDIVIPVPPKRSMIDVPEVTEPLDELGQFSYERHRELMNKVDALYNNYLVKHDEMLASLTEFSRAYDEMISEGIRPRM